MNIYQSREQKVKKIIALNFYRYFFNGRIVPLGPAFQGIEITEKDKQELKEKILEDQIK